MHTSISTQFNYSPIVLLLLLLTLFTFFNCSHYQVDAIKVPASVIINKCCRNGERLEPHNQQCSTGSTEKWWPLIYLILKQTYFSPPGDSPRFFKVRENTWPECENMEIYTGKSHALFSNGTLYLLEKHMLLDTKSYCVDNDVAVVCLPEVLNFESRRLSRKLAKVKKCCGTDAVYSATTSTCISIENGSEMKKRLLHNASDIDIVYGLPQCRDERAVAIANAFHESHLDHSTGSLTLDSGQQFSWNEYCLEHTVDVSNVPYVSVMTCMEYVPVLETAVAVAPTGVSDTAVAIMSII